MRRHWPTILVLAALGCADADPGPDDGHGGREAPPAGPDPWALCTGGVCLTAPSIGVAHVDGMWLDGADRVWLAAVTDEQLTVVRSDGENWQVVGEPVHLTPLPEGLAEASGPGTIDGSAPDSLWGLGRRSAIRWDGTSWSQNQPFEIDFDGLLVQDVNSVFLQGQGIVWHWNGTDWRQTERTSSRLHKGPDGTAWLLGYDSLHRWTADGWLAHDLEHGPLTQVVLLGETSRFLRTWNYHAEYTSQSVIHEESGRSLELRPHHGITAFARLPGDQAVFLASGPRPQRVGQLVHWDGERFTASDLNRSSPCRSWMRRAPASIMCTRRAPQPGRARRWV